ncbi:MAG TPA: glycosyltransferase [Acidimicrobiales bacterium]|nr:glycosyltransferase [Acidimicrobiales bacterium]
MALVTVVIATRDRRVELLRTLDRLAALPERPPVVVVDNGSSDGSPDAVRAAHPAVRVVELGTNRGAPARNVGVDAAATPYVAFADDDSWWAPGSLARAAELFAGHPRLAVIAARILVGPEERLDRVCTEMAASPLTPPPGIALPGPPVLGFVACGALVRRAAFLEVGGFDDVVFFFGEEQRVALDLDRAGWHLAYVEDVVAHHYPSSQRVPAARRALAVRNDLLTTWMRRPLRPALARTARALRRAVREPAQRAGLAQAAPRLRAALAERRPVPAALERRVRLLEASSAPARLPDGQRGSDQPPIHDDLHGRADGPHERQALATGRRAAAARGTGIRP